MRTDDLIGELSGKLKPAGGVARPLALAVLLALVGGFLVMVLGPWGLRPDLRQALLSGPFWMKAGYSAAFAVAGALLVERLGRPDGRGRLGWIVLGLAAAAIAALAAAELAGLPRSAWHADMMGHSSQICAVSVALISAPAFAAALWLMRRLAPTRPRLAGAAAGLLASGLGATVYGLFCQETSAAFTALWYTSAMLVWPAVGALVGPRLLRW
jgi:hypothetical protein